MSYRPRVGSTNEIIYRYLLVHKCISRTIIRDLIKNSRANTNMKTIDGIISFLKRKFLIQYVGGQYVSNVYTDMENYSIVNHSTGNPMIRSKDLIDILKKARRVPLYIKIDILYKDKTLLAYRHTTGSVAYF
jgi:hypothetical protein